MKKFTRVLAVAAALSLSPHSPADDHCRPPRAAIDHSVTVKSLSGSAHYAYDSSGWKPLHVGKVLLPGATLRTSPKSSVILATDQPGSLLRVGPSRRLQLMKAAPVAEHAARSPLPLSCPNTFAKRGLGR